MHLERRLPTFLLLIVFGLLTVVLWLIHAKAFAGLFGAFDAYLLLSLAFMPTHSVTSPQHICVGPLRWTFEDFRSHWLCVGKSGCGKTIAFFQAILIELCRKMPNWGGVAIDEKGDFWRLMTRIFNALKLPTKLIVIRVRKPGDKSFVPQHTMNLIGDPGVPLDTWAQIIVDVAVTQGQKSSNPHFKTQGRLKIRDALQTLQCVGLPVTLSNAYEFLKFPAQQAPVMELLHDMKDRSEEAAGLIQLWEEFYKIDPGELSGIKTTAEGYLAPYSNPEIAEVFCAAKPTLSFRVIDQGKVLAPSVPQAYLTQRSYIIAFFKLLYYYHGLRRYDEGEADENYIDKCNDLVLINDEAQNSLLPSEEGMSDIKALDKLRAAKCTVIFSMQDFISAVPPIGGMDRAKTLFTNLNNYVIFKINTADGRKMAADIIDKSMQAEDTVSCGQDGRRSNSRRKVAKYQIEPHMFKKMRKFHCVIQHTEGEFIKSVLPPLNDDGNGVKSWYWIERWKPF